jgi:hypothetical protein
MKAIKRRAFQSEAMGLRDLAWGKEQGARSLGAFCQHLALSALHFAIFAHLSIDKNVYRS